MAVRRIYKEWVHSVERPVEGISFGPFAGNVFNWDAIIEGPVQFKTRIYHPNISQEGLISLDILREKWGPGRTIAKVLLSVRCLLMDGVNPDDPLEPDVARLYKNDRTKYEETVREWTRKYAM